MAINKKLIHFKSKENFDREVANENILDTSICFIQDSKEISTHGTIYKSVNWSVLDDPFVGHAYVDLGLPSGTLWATCNVGAASYDECGDYFAWGEVSPKSDYNASNSDTYGLSISELLSRGIIDENCNLTAKYDAATVNWGGLWKTPTKEDFEELFNNCTVSIHSGTILEYWLTGPNKHSLRLPAWGYFNTKVNNENLTGDYWTSTANLDESYYCWFNVSSEIPPRLSQISRKDGLTIRPVIKLNK